MGHNSGAAAATATTRRRCHHIRDLAVWQHHGDHGHAGLEAAKAAVSE